MGCSTKVMGVALSFSFIWFLLLVSLADWNIKTRDIITVPSTKSIRFLKTMGTEKSGLHHKFSFNIVSRRRVPNGPDPIHNREVGVSKLPPT